jgi:nucleotide-binding universal stress UspA family protein
MLTVRTIIHPTDFSSYSMAAYGLACALARDYGARLVVVHVRPPLVVFAELPPFPPEPPEVLKKVREKLYGLTPPYPGIAVGHRLLDGDPAAGILRVAREENGDLIVMGTHGLSGVARMLMGSVAEDVLRRAPCPVLTVKTPSMPESPPTESSGSQVRATP